MHYHQYEVSFLVTTWTTINQEKNRHATEEICPKQLGQMEEMNVSCIQKTVIE